MSSYFYSQNILYRKEHQQRSENKKAMQARFVLFSPSVVRREHQLPTTILCVNLQELRQLRSKFLQPLRAVCAVHHVA